MDNFRNAVKAFIVKDNKLLMLKRRANDVHKPGAWDIPGGRLELGEDPYEGLKREASEECQIAIEIIMPLSVHHFTREDGQKITLTIYWCKMLTEQIKLSEEHQEYKWMDLDQDLAQIPEFFQLSINNFKKYIRP
ncbi:MAG TPA: NUDIX domain-containing protein [Methylomirabilota bacterium]|jgi:mutator protein MutT|nr:NUDIX domain-containing protein [Methylomirabilota bacterium]